MLDWKKMKFEDFTFEVDVESIQDVGVSVVFPVHVKLQDGTPVFVHGVALRAEFFGQLKQSPHWETALMKILKTRVREEILRRRKLESLPIDEKLRLFHRDPQPLG